MMAPWRSVLLVSTFSLSVFISFQVQANRTKVWFSQCVACHGTKAEGKKELGAPSIAGLPQWYIESQLKKFKDGIRGLHPKDDPGSRMRPMAMALLHPGDLEAVAKYVASLPPQKPPQTMTGGNVENGKQLYATCVACHGADGKGNQALQAPPLTHANDWYIFRQLKNFTEGIRGADAAKDPMAASMAPMVQTLGGEQGMRDVIAYILTLQ